MLSRLSSFLSGSKIDGRVEAFFSCIPMEYCGFSKEGNPVWSPGFPDLFGMTTLQGLEDIYAALTPSDAAALEGYFTQLKNEHEDFSLECTAEKTGLCLKIDGRIGYPKATAQDAAGHKGDAFFILWVQDISSQADRLEELQTGHEVLTHEKATLSAILDHLPIPVWAKNLSDQLTYCNALYSRWVGTEREQVIEDNSALPFVAQKDAIQFENRGRIIIKGKRHIVTLVERDVPEQAMKAGFVLDQTEEDRLTTELTRQNRATQELLGHMSSAIAVFAADTRLEFFNPAFSALWDMKESWLNTKPQLNLIMDHLRDERKLPEQADFRSYKQSWIDLFTSLLEPKQEMLYLPDGRALRLLIVPHPMGGLMMTFEDVTSRLELESSYNTLIAVQRETLDNLGEGVAVFSGSGQIRLWNPSFLELWGLEEEQLANQPHISSLVDLKEPFFTNNPDQWAQIRPRLISFALEREERKEEMTRDDGSCLECVTATLPDGGMMVTFRDITNEIEAEKALKDRNNALEAADNLKSEFLANVSYQLRTPLNAIMGFAEILTNGFFGPLNDKQNEYAGGIAEAGGRLTALIDNILDLASIEAGKLELDIETVDIHAMLEDIFSLAMDWAGQSGLQVSLSCEASVGHAEIDPRRVKQALLNLVGNAIAYTPEGGHLTIKGLADGPDHILLVVEDTGIGMNEKDREAFLKPFARGQSQQGGGLGLTIVQHMTDLHHGTLTLDSQPDEGTSVTLRLPRNHQTG